MFLLIKEIFRYKLLQHFIKQMKLNQNTRIKLLRLLQKQLNNQSKKYSSLKI